MMKLFFAITIFLSVTCAQAEVRNINNAELTKLMSEGVAVIDIRTPPEWKETGVVQGSHLLMLFDEKGKADAPVWLKQVQSVVKSNQPVILICRTGNRTKAATQFLSQQAGYTSVYNVTDGIREWIKAGGRVVASLK